MSTKTQTIFTLLALPAAVSGVYAANLHADDFYLREYLDLAQNKGQFQAGATDVVLVKKDGNFFEMPALPIPDFSPVAKKGATTSIGGAYYVTATHNGESLHVIQTQTWGNTDYHHVGWESNGDFAAGRLDKFVVETEGLTGIADTSLSSQAFIDRYGVDYNGKKSVIGFRVGAGHTYFTKDGQKIDTSKQYEPDLLSGSMFELTMLGSDVVANTMFTDFINETEGGDSGSAYFVYDSVEKKWVLLGTHFGMYNQYSKPNFVDKATIDRVKDRFTQAFDLAGNTVSVSNLTINQDGRSTAMKAQKDLKLSGGGTLSLESHLHMDSAGLIFGADEEYSVVSTDPAYSFKGAGLDIGAGTTVHWNVKGEASDNLHKIGKGTLEVNVSQGSNLKLGDGEVRLHTAGAFENIYITSGRATVKLDHADALQKTATGGIYFGDRGGTLDLNGFDQTFGQLAMNDAGAVVANRNSEKKSIVTLTGNGKQMLHGQFQGNLDVDFEKTEKSADNHLILDGGSKIDGTLSVKNASLTLQGHATEHAIFREGGVKCQLELAPGLCLGWDKDYVAVMEQLEKEIAQQRGEGYKTNNQRSSFDQPDWDHRRYEFGSLTLENTDLRVGHAASLVGNIEATGSSIVLGGNVPVFIDRHDGNNLTNNGFGFRQDVVEGVVLPSGPQTLADGDVAAKADESVFYRGRITARDTAVRSNAALSEVSLNLTGKSIYEAAGIGALTRLIGDVKVADDSRVTFRDVVIHEETTPVFIKTEGNAGLTMENLFVDSSVAHLTGIDVNGVILAENAGEVHLDKWLYEGDLMTDDTSVIKVRDLTIGAGQHHADARIVVDRSLDLGKLDFVNTDVGFGFHADSLTLGKEASVSAGFTSDSLSLNNFQFGEGYTLISADDFNDNRNDKSVAFEDNGSGLFFSAESIDGELQFAIHKEDPKKPDIPLTPLEPSNPIPKPDIPLTPLEPSNPIPKPEIPLTPLEPSNPIPKPEIPLTPLEPSNPIPKPEIPLTPLEPSNPIPKPEIPLTPLEPSNPIPKPDIPLTPIKPSTPVPQPDVTIPATPVNPSLEAREHAVWEAYAATYGLKPGDVEMVRSMIEHNLASDNKYQEVALYDALHQLDASAGARALNDILRRTQTSFDALAVKTNVDQLFAPVRLSVLGRTAITPAKRLAADNRAKFFIDLGAGLFEDDGDFHYEETSFGWDSYVRAGEGEGIVGVMMTFGKNSLTAGSTSVKTDAYTVTGYGSWHFAEGYEVTNALSLTYLDGEREAYPEIRLGKQTFDEKSVIAMNSTYLKTVLTIADGLAVKPLVTIDFAQEWTEKTTSTYFKRDSSETFYAWAGLGAEVEWTLPDARYSLLATARHRLTGDNRTIGVNLRDASGFIAQKVDAGASTTFELAATLEQRLTTDWSLDVSLLGEATDEGGLGMTGRARVNYYF